MPYLAVGVVAPGPQDPAAGAVALQRVGVVQARGDCHDAGQARDLARGAPGGGRPIAELPIIVIAKRPQRAVSLQHQRVRVPGGHRHRIAERNLGRGRDAAIVVAVAQTATGRITPRHDRAIRLDGH